MKKKSKPMETDILVGGQAILEGVMMRTPHACGTAVRHPDGTLVFQVKRVPRWTDTYPVLKWPFIRGTAILIQSMVIGIKALNFSAEVAMAAEHEAASHATEETPEAGETASSTHSRKRAKTKTRGATGRAALVGTMLFSLVLGIAVFVLVPYWLSGHVTRAFYPGADLNTTIHTHWFLFNAIDGVVKVIFFLVYILAISRMKDIHRVFQYHGAEHKVVNLWESKAPRTVEGARLHSTLHPRCGTSFLLFVMAVSIVVFTIFKFDWWVWKVLSRIALLPLVAGISYELIRVSARFPKFWLCRLLMQPGLWMQRITTQPPDDTMLEVALQALEKALAVEVEVRGETSPGEDPEKDSIPPVLVEPITDGN